MTSRLTSSPLTNNKKSEIKIIYDGECPLCQNYVRLVKLREIIDDVQLIDARTNPDYVSAMNDKGLNIDQGMLVVYGDALYYGADAMHILSMLSNPKSWINAFIAFFFKNKTLAKLLYPICKAFRNAVLFILRRTKINAS